jgi:hypothetical protein
VREGGAFAEAKEGEDGEEEGGEPIVEGGDEAGGDAATGGNEGAGEAGDQAGIGGGSEEGGAVAEDDFDPEAAVGAVAEVGGEREAAALGEVEQEAGVGEECEGDEEKGEGGEEVGGAAFGERRQGRGPRGRWATVILGWWVQGERTGSAKSLCAGGWLEEQVIKCPAGEEMGVEFDGDGRAAWPVREGERAVGGVKRHRAECGATAGRKGPEVG